MKNREAEALSRLLDGSTPDEGSTELRPLLQLAQALQTPVARPDDAFKNELRAMLVQEARVMHAAPRLVTRVRTQMSSAAERWRYSTRVAAASLAAAMSFSGAGAVAVAAEHALPSDTFYSVKLAIDEARVAVRFDEVRKGEQHLSNASQRIDEAEISVALNDQSGAAKALNKSADSARRGASEMIKGYQSRGDRAIVAQLNTFAAVQGARVRLLAERLEGDAAKAAQSSLVVMARIEARLVAISGVCADCPAAAPEGQAFDFSDIPPADEPFQPCPCDEGAEDPQPRTRRRGNNNATTRPEPTPTASETSSPSPDPTGPGDGLPAPVDDVVNELLKPIVTKSAEKGLGGMPTPSAEVPSGGLGLPGLGQ